MKNLTVEQFDIVRKMQCGYRLLQSTLDGSFQLVRPWRLTGDYVYVGDVEFLVVNGLARLRKNGVFRDVYILTSLGLAVRSRSVY